MERFSVREVVEQAVRTERLGYEFYTTIADRFKENKGLKELFETLAGKELIHEKRFLDLEKTIGGEVPDKWEDISEYLRAIVESEFFLGKNKSLPSLSHVKTVDDAVNFAMGFEKETLLHFYGLRDAVKDKGPVDEIIGEEQSHIRWLAQFRDALTK